MKAVLRYNVTPELVAEVERLPMRRQRAGSGHGGEDYSRGWIGDGLETCRPALKYHPHLYAAVDALLAHFPRYELFQVIVNRLDPHRELDKHRDGHSVNLRFHLPIVTNAFVRWWDEINGTYFMTPNHWHGPAMYSGVMHMMENYGDEPRIHVVADLIPPK